MSDQTFSGKQSLSVIAISQDLRVACDTCNAHNASSHVAFKHYLYSPMEAVIKALVALWREPPGRKRHLPSSSKIMSSLLKSLATAENITTVDADFRSFNRKSLRAAYHAQRLQKRTLRSSYVYNENILKGLVVEVVPLSICWILFSALARIPTSLDEGRGAEN